nr:hypothetical protein [Bartonella massiliensis]
MLSGTEPVICMMGQGDTREVLDTVVTELMDVITHHDARVGAPLEES